MFFFGGGGDKGTPTAFSPGLTCDGTCYCSAAEIPRCLKLTSTNEKVEKSSVWEDINKSYPQVLNYTRSVEKAMQHCCNKNKVQ
jgi:hypothetical protein